MDDFSTCLDLEPLLSGSSWNGMELTAYTWRRLLQSKACGEEEVF